VEKSGGAEDGEEVEDCKELSKQNASLMIGLDMIDVTRL
jgi:hypothetical protein